MTVDARTKPSDRNQQRDPLKNDRDQEWAEDRWSVLSFWDAEVRQQRYGPARLHTPQSANGNPRILLGVRKQSVSVIPAMELKRMRLGTDRALARLIADQHVGPGKIGVDTACGFANNLHSYASDVCGLVPQTDRGPCKVRALRGPA